MKLKTDIRTRMLAAALLPALFVGLMLAGLLLAGRSDDLQVAYEQRIRSLARQVAASSEYGLFVANQEQLQAIARGALREPDVRCVAILNTQRQLMAGAGECVGQADLPWSGQEASGHDALRHLDWLTQPVLSTPALLDALYEDTAPAFVAPPLQLGQVMIKVSSQGIQSQQRDMLLLGLAIGLGGLLMGLSLALRLSRGVLQPVLRVKQQIERIGQGDFDAVYALKPNENQHDALADLQQPLQAMASQLAQVQDHLQRQVAQATQALEEKKNLAEQADRAKSRFLAAASHDLRQPTHALGLFISRLGQLSHNAQTREIVTHLEASVRALQNLLDGLLDISRLDAHAVQAQRQPFALQPLLEQLVQDLRLQATAKGLELRYRPTPLWVDSDPNLLGRVLMNLLSNAIRYTNRGGVLLAARVCEQGRMVRLMVLDTGVGIAPEHQQAVFQEFYQVANAQRDRRQGLGLGLNIVRRTLDLLGHDLQLQSLPGRGTCMSVRVPLAPPGQVNGLLPDALAGVNSPLSLGSGLDWARKQVLVIEDDALVAQALISLLQGWGLQVRHAGTAAEAVNLVKGGWRPDAVVSDYRLPGGDDGLQAIQLLRGTLGARVPACLVSGDTAPDLMHRAQAAGLVLLHKPVRPAKLRTLLRRLLPDAPQAEGG